MGLLLIKDLNLSFGGIQALDGVNLDLEEGEIITVIGPNGSGKTTLFNCISGVYKPTGGSITFQGESLLGLSPDQVAARGIARTFQNLRLFMHMTVLDNLMLGRHIKFYKNPLHAFLRLRKEEIRHREVVEDLIDFLQLQPWRTAIIADCPYGIQKRAEMGRALALDPRLLMLDEPISGLTAEEKQATAYLINEIKGRFQLSILLVEHDLRIASALADRMVALENGVKIAEGTSAEVQRHPDVVRAYMGTKGEADGLTRRDTRLIRSETGVEDCIPTGLKTVPALGAETPILRIANIETLYFDRVCALNGVTFTIGKNQIVAVLGPNGAGKTTLLKTVAGLLKDQPKKGTIEFEGHRLHRLEPEQISSRGIVYVPEDRGLFRELTVKENLEIGGSGRNREELKQDMEWVYELFPILAERGSQQAELLSGGQQQMLAVARAMLRRPRLLMLDEPSLGLAPLVARMVYEVLLKIAQIGTTILLVEQNAGLALSIADFGYILEGGRIVLEGTAAQLLAHEDVQKLYLGLSDEGGSSKGWRLYKKRRTW
ncbi:MAG: ATP-binding cassette domain-containing protein [Pseudomonadota bacterium]